MVLNIAQTLLPMPRIGTQTGAVLKRSNLIKT